MIKSTATSLRPVRGIAKPHITYSHRLQSYYCYGGGSGADGGSIVEALRAWQCRKGFMDACFDLIEMDDWVQAWEGWFDSSKGSFDFRHCK